MPTVDELTAALNQLETDITEENTIIDSAVTAFEGLAAQMAAVAGDRDKTLALSGQVKAKAQALAAAIPVNTPTP